MDRPSRREYRREVERLARRFRLPEHKAAQTALDLASGTWGEQLLSPGERLMEIKISNAMPLWLAEALSGCGIYPTSFSKYGKAYETLLWRELHGKEEVRYA